MKHIANFILVFLCLIRCGYAQELITNFDNDALPVLNEELRKLSAENNGGTSDLTNVSGVLSVTNGGTGEDFSGAGPGSVIYFDTTGSMTVLGAGTSGYFLQTRSTTLPPMWNLPDSSTTGVMFSYTFNATGSSGTGGSYATAETLTHSVTSPHTVLVLANFLFAGATGSNEDFRITADGSTVQEFLNIDEDQDDSEMMLFGIVSGLSGSVDFDLDAAVDGGVACVLTEINFVVIEF